MCETVASLLKEKGADVELYSVSEKSPKDLAEADIYIFSSPTRMGNPVGKVKGFIKKMQNQIDYKDHAYRLLNPHLEQELRFGTGEAYGFEILLKKYQGRLNGWIGYAWSRSWRHIEDINNNELIHVSANNQVKLHII